MPDFEIQDDRGRKIRMTGDQPPSQTDIDAAFAAAYPEPPTPTATTARPGFFSRVAGDVVPVLQGGVQLAKVAAGFPGAVDPILSGLSDVAKEAWAGHPLKAATRLIGGNPEHIYEDVKAGNLPALAGDLVTPGAMLFGPKLAKKLPAVLERTPAEKMAAVDAARAARVKAPAEVNKAYFKNLEQAIGPTAKTPHQDVINKTGAMPHLAAEHAASPIETMPQLVEASDRAIGTIQGVVDKAIDAYPEERISTNPMEAVKQALTEMKGARGSDLAAGLKAVKDFGIGGTSPTLRKAADVLFRLNAETKAIRLKNKYDVATIRATDPAYVAMEAMSDALRDGMFDTLETKGVPGIRQLRREQGNVIAVRNAAQKNIFKGDQPVGAATGGPLMSRLTAKTVKYGSASIGAGAGYAAGGGLTGAAGAAIGGVLGERLANRIAPRLTRNDLIKGAFKGLNVEAPTFPETPPAAPVPSHPSPVPAMPPRSAPAMAVPQTASAQRPLPVQAPAALPLTGEPPQAPPVGSGVPAAAETGAVGTPVAPRGPVVRGGEAQPRGAAQARVAAARSQRTGAPQGGVAALPESARADFHSLLPFARKQGFSGTVDELADRYRVKLDAARNIQREASLPAEDLETGRAGRELLRDISNLGGFGINEEAGLSGKGGMKGELEHMLENLNKRSKSKAVIKRGKRMGQEVTLPPRMSGGLKGLPNIVVRKGGYPVDYVFEHIRQDPRWANTWERQSDFLEAVNKAIYEEASGIDTPTEQFSLSTIMRDLLDVNPDRQWWIPEPSEARTALASIRAAGFEPVSYSPERGWDVESSHVSDRARSTGRSAARATPPVVQNALKVLNQLPEDAVARLINEKDE